MALARYCIDALNLEGWLDRRKAPTQSAPDRVAIILREHTSWSWWSFAN